MNDVNPQQRQAIEHVDSPLLVLAGAGSGKTRVITGKIAHLVREHEIPARRLAAVTFTNKAAREMRSRAGELLGRKDRRGLTVSTFHTLGLGFLRQEHRQLGYKPGFSIFDPHDTATLLQELASKEDQAAGAEDQARAAISRWKNDLVSPEKALDAAADEREATLARLYGRYQRQLRAYNAFDFDDLILQPVMLLQEQPGVRERWQQHLHHLLIDEYQDTNAAQYELVRLVLGQGHGLTVVGDDDQSIYAWRGARPENLARLSQDYPHLRVIKLEQNYRSSGRILATANHLIAANPHMFSKRLWSALGTGDPIRVVACKSADHEAERVVSEILRHRFQKRSRYGDHAILYRGNYQARPLEKVLREQHVPYRLSGGTSFFERTEIKDLMAYLRLLANPDDDTAFLRIVNTPRREIGASTLERLGTYAGERHLSLLAASRELGLAQRIGERARHRLQSFADWLGERARQAQSGEPVAAARRLLTEAGYQDWLRETSRDPKVAERRIANADELVAWMERLSQEDERSKADIADLVSHMSLVDMLDRREDAGDGDAVQLMTLHAAKGLEFPHVYIVGVEEGLLPHAANLDEERLQEERRLAYVGITRAQRSLMLTFATSRKRYGEAVDSEPSRFLDELPEDHVVWEGREPPSPEQARETGKAHLSSLKQLLEG